MTEDAPTPLEINFSKIYSRIAQTTEIPVPIIERTIVLMKDGNTIPFIARYRKELTQGLDEIKLREIKKNYSELHNLEERKISVIQLIHKQEKLTPAIQQSIVDASNLQEVEDLYLPFKPKFRTLGAKARAKGLEPLADMIRANKVYDHPTKELVSAFVDSEKGVEDVSSALEGAMDIIAEEIGADPENRKYVREVITKQNSVICEVKEDILTNSELPRTPDGKEIDPTIFENYFHFSGFGQNLQPYQLLAIDRAQKYGILEFSIKISDENIIHELEKRNLHGHSSKSNQFFRYFKKAVEKGYKRYISRSIKREYWNSLMEKAEIHAISVFADNLKHLILTPPLKYRGVIGLDPGFRTGCKVALIDEFGNYLDHGTIYPHPPQKRVHEADRILFDFCQKYGIFTFAIGNGTASRETERFMADFVKNHQNSSLPFEYAIVNEAGASVYSASKLAHEEFPDLDATVRGAISIARRLQDPLSELIKIDPKSIGVGLYQHDVNQTKLREELDAVIEDCVNSVGVDLNTASSKLLEYVSGLSHKLAQKIVHFRQNQQSFTDRNQIQTIPGIGAKTFQQCAGFLKIRNASNIFDSTFVHPESYDVSAQICEKAKLNLQDLVTPSKHDQVVTKLGKLHHQEIAKTMDMDPEKVRYLIDQLMKSNFDPRDELDPVILRQDVMSFDDLKDGMIIKGTVRNVVDFGAFVDIGVKYNGLVHKSEIANQFVKDPRDFLAVGEVYDFMIIRLDKTRKRIQLSLKQVPTTK